MAQEAIRTGGSDRSGSSPAGREGFLGRLGLFSLEDLANGTNAVRLLGFLYISIGLVILLSQWLLTEAEVSHRVISVAGSLFLIAGVSLAAVYRGDATKGFLTAMVVMGFAGMAMVNYAVYGALGPYRIIYVLLFAYAGVSLKPLTSLILIPFAAASYVGSEIVSKSELSLAFTGLAVSIPVWFLTAEFLARGSERLAKVNRDLVTRNEEVHAAADFQRSFVASASHELRTPLTSISGYVELLMESERLNDEDRSDLSIVARNAERLQALINDLLLVHSMESGNVALTFGSVAVCELIAPVTDSFRPLSEKRDVSISVGNVLDSTSVWIDRERTEQVLTNLMGNALKFTEPGGSIDIDVDEYSNNVEIHIRDTGPGIPEDELPLIFGRFFRSSTSVKAAVPGTGLGLAIAKELVELQGGEIRVSSVAGEGTTFSVCLPKGD